MSNIGVTFVAHSIMLCYQNELQVSLTQAFKQWVPSLSEGDVNVVLSAKNSATSGLVNIISYDLLVKMVSEVHEKKFRAIIAVSTFVTIIMFLNFRCSPFKNHKLFEK